jgi:hypothetical protein
MEGGNTISAKRSNNPRSKMKSPMCTEAAADHDKGEAFQLRSYQPPVIEPQHAAEYIGDVLSDLKTIAAKSGFKFLAALIEVSIEEARQQAREAQNFAETV